MLKRRAKKENNFDKFKSNKEIKKESLNKRPPFYAIL